ncbi:hypothetical protein QM012_000021 [Aureobasidium pullulans]|uniref:Zn(2)-C6 fungal-type domain-containing protein n=1 Tax=Aureobasidium pullulans TaxID=5580 RepID=A0ABR0TUI6_AURPU
MPRPKVRPENRQRAYKACASCKSLKKRCDSLQPCSTCIRRRQASSCSYLDNDDIEQGSHRAESPRVVTTDAQDPSPTSRTDAEPIHVDQCLTPRDSPNETNDDTSGPQLPESRMLLNSKGERVFVGKIASLSFLHFLRRVLKWQMGPNTFTEYARENVMLEAGDLTGRLQASPGSEQTEQRTLIDCFFAATNGILHLYTRDEMMYIMSSANDVSAKSYREDNAAINLVIAIGAQCRGLDHNDLQIAAKYFAMAQKAAFESMLQDPSINMVRIFLLMAFYMLGACQRNAAFMYIGVASKAASALGLHVAPRHCCFDEEDQDRRSRTWKSLCILDLLVTSILGRLSSSPTSRLDFSTSIPAEGSTESLSFEAVHDECAMIGDMVNDLTEDGDLDVKSAESFLQRLGEWNRGLPSQLRRFDRKDSMLLPQDRELAIGRIHVACVYYFAVMLATRPFFIRHAMTRLRDKAGIQHKKADAGSIESQKERLAEVCVDSAIFMGKMTHEALKADLLLCNMCMLKAWMFAAGLVLGFAIYVDDAVRGDIEEAFSEVRTVLKKLSDLSPQAEEYFEILSSFSDAINAHRDELSRRRRAANQQYVSQLLTIGSDQVAHQSSDTQMTDFSTGFNYDLPDMMSTMSSQMSNGLDMMFNFDATDVASFGLPTDFSPNVEPLGMFFGSI